MLGQRWIHVLRLRTLRAMCRWKGRLSDWSRESTSGRKRKDDTLKALKMLQVLDHLDSLCRLPVLDMIL